MESKQYKPAEFAELVGVTVKTLQRWDRDGTLSAFRTETNRRYYTYEQYESIKDVCAENKSKYLRNADRNDILDEYFGELHVVKCVSDDSVTTGAVRYECCCSCGNVVVVPRKDLLSGNTSSCGCLRTKAFVQRMNRRPDGSVRDVIFLSDLPGHRCTPDLSDEYFGRLHVLRLDRAYVRSCGKTAVMWVCECRCGSVLSVDAQALRSGHTISCGCYERDHASRLVDLTNRRFGMLVAKERVGTKRAFAVWRCECDCGNVKDVPSNQLVHGMTSSCGCMKQSKNETYVVNYFKSIGLVASIDYKSQYTIDGLVGVGGRLLSYDFALFKNGELYALIECQGQQHYEPVDWYGGESKFLQQQEHDARKHRCAEDLNVPLFELPYTVRKYSDVENKMFEFLNSIQYFV